MMAHDDATLARLLAEVRARHDLPAMAAAVVTSAGVVSSGVVGVRKRGTEVAATASDCWHLGSCTKSMTATLVGSFVAEGRLTWETPVAPLLPEPDRVHEAHRTITIGDLLSHRAGLARDPQPQVLFELFKSQPPAGGDFAATCRWLADVRQRQPPLIEQRARIAALALAAPPAVPPGTWSYSNTGIVIAAAVLERMMGVGDLEELVRSRLLAPLGIAASGFYGLGTPGIIDQPWPHGASGEPLPVNGPAMDGFAAIAPAGMVHCPIHDWARFLCDQLHGARGQPALLPSAIYARIHRPCADHVFGGRPGYGWLIYQEASGAPVLSHNGSNGMNFAVCNLIPERDVGVLVCTNQGGEAANRGCHELLTAAMPGWNTAPHATQ